jgi:hypothetical protein
MAAQSIVFLELLSNVFPRALLFEIIAFARLA